MGALYNMQNKISPQVFMKEIKLLSKMTEATVCVLKQYHYADITMQTHHSLYIKMGFTRVYIIFLICVKTDCEYLLKQAHQETIPMRRFSRIPKIQVFFFK